MRIDLPAKIELNCPKCRGKFTVHVQQLHQRSELGCPFCREVFRVYDALPANLKRKVYYTIRDEMEHQVYNEHRKQHTDYFDIWGTNVSSDYPDKPQNPNS